MLLVLREYVETGAVIEDCVQAIAGAIEKEADIKTTFRQSTICNQYLPPD